MLMPQYVLIMGTWKCLAGISTLYDAYVRPCATEDLCDKTQTQFSMFTNAHIIIIIIIIIISHKPSNSIDFPFLTHG
jgi:hypothetical protein